MASQRRFNFLGQARVEAPHLRMLEAAAAADLDALAGRAVCGNVPRILTGFELADPTVAAGKPASSLSLLVAGAVLLHPTATTSGTVFTVPADRAPETLSGTNGRVEGSFVAGATNYVGIDVRRSASAATADQVVFLAAGSDPPEEFARQVPLGLIADYVLVVSTVDFGATPALCPALVVVVDGSGAVTSVTDARNRLYHLGSGGGAPDELYAYPWAQGRIPINAGGFRGGDRAIASLKDWMDAAMTRVWEVAGGERWFSAVTPANVKLTRSGALFTNGEHFEWDGTDLHWKGLKFVFPNSTGYYNAVADQTSNSAGLTDLADGECVYVDLDFSANRTGGTALVAAKATSALLGSPTVPGGRHVLAWRVGSSVYSRDQAWAVGTHFSPATTTSLGVVKLSGAPTDSANPFAATVETVNLRALVKGLIRATAMGDGGIDLVSTYAQGTGGPAQRTYSGSTLVHSIDSAGTAAVEAESVKRSAHVRPTLTHSASGFTAVTQTGAGTGTVVPSGPCAWNHRFVVKVTTAGAVATAYIAISVDGGVTYGSPVITASTVTHAATGVVLTLANTFVLNDLYSFQSYFGALATYAADDAKVKAVVEHTGFPGGRRSEFREEWFWTWAARTADPTPNPYPWIVSRNDGSVSTGFSKTVGVRGRYLQLDVDNLTNDYALLRTPPFTWHNATTTLGMVLTFESEVIVNTNVTHLTTMVGIGEGGATVATGGYYLKTNGGGNWFAVTRDSGGATETSTDTGKNVGTRNDRGVARIRIEYRLVASTSSVAFFINEELVALHTANLMLDADFCVQVGALNDGSDGSAAGQVLLGPVLAQWNRRDEAPQF